MQEENIWLKLLGGGTQIFLDDYIIPSKQHQNF